MSIDTLAYSKTLEEAGLDRKAAEAHAEALARHVVPELVTRADLEQAIERIDKRLDQANNRLDQAVERLENRMDLAIERAEHRITLRLIGIVGAFDAALFALLRFVH